MLRTEFVGCISCTVQVVRPAHPTLWEMGKDKVQRFSWVTDLRVSKHTVSHLMRGGRARWKIENETFNTLKNQG